MKALTNYLFFFFQTFLPFGIRFDKGKITINNLRWTALRRANQLQFKMSPIRIIINLLAFGKFFRCGALMCRLAGKGKICFDVIFRLRVSGNILSFNGFLEKSYQSSRSGEIIILIRRFVCKYRF